MIRPATPVGSDAAARHLPRIEGGGCARFVRARHTLLRSKFRRVTTRFFGKSVITGKIVIKAPILPLVLMLTLGSVTPGGRAEQAGRTATPQVQSRPTPGRDNLNRWQQKTSVDQTPAISPRALLDSSIAALENTGSISATIFHEVDLFNRRLVGKGVYWEQRQGPHRLIRYELKLQLGDQTSSLVQVLAPPTADGHFMWTKRKLRDGEKLSRLDVTRAMKALAEVERKPRHEGREISPGLGGLPRILRGLHSAFDFISVQAGQLRLQSDRLPVWQLRGQWKPEQLSKVLPRQKEAIEAGEDVDLGKLPEHLPDHVLLMLGQDDLFPYRIEYRRVTGRKTDGPESHPLVTMQLFEVVRNVPIDPGRFQYSPGTLEFQDQTESFLKSLGVEP